MSNFDEHYCTLDNQPIEVMEERIICTDGISEAQALNLAIALKHIIRAGHKHGQPWKKDIGKAMNYLYRALHGEWIPNDSEIPNSSKPESWVKK